MPQCIGPFDIISVLGQGGMGTVYLAEQTTPVDRRVALKVVKFGMDRDWILERFELERRALARMTHPNIAVVYDAGTTEDGTPYLAMEYIEGEPITKYCDTRQLKTAQRLALFLKVCEAIRHAHRKMIIHRDLKPSNILITEQDGKPEPKVIDFGIARDTRREIALTKAGNPIGTPMYMSPEQIEGNPEDVDARVDVYVLGVLLYELLTGAQPYESSHGAEHRLMIRILEEDPPSPSTRLTTLGATLDEVAQKRGTNHKVLHSQLKGDLDWIVMKAMEKQREKRYESVDALQRDIECLLANKPITARPPSLTDKWRKFVRRHRVTVTAALLILLALIVGIAATTYAMIRADRARQVAERQERRANRTVAYLQQILSSADPHLEGRDVTLTSLLTKASQSRDEDLHDQPEVEEAVRQTLGWTYLELGLYERAEQELETAVRLRTETLGEDHTDTLASVNALGRLHYKQGKYAEAEPIHRRVLSRQQELLGPEDDTTLWTMYNLAKVLDKQDDFEEAESLYRGVIEMRRGLSGPDHSQELVVVNSLGLLLSRRGDLSEAERLLKENRAKLIRKSGEDHPNTLSAGANLVAVLVKRGHFREALALGEQIREKQLRVLGANHPETLGTDAQIAQSMIHLQQLPGALAKLEKVIAEQVALLGPNHPDTVTTRANLAVLLEITGNLEEAEKAYAACAAAASHYLPADHWQIAYFKGLRGRCLYRLGKLERAEALLGDSLAVLDGSGREERAAILTTLIDLYTATGDEEKARKLRALRY